MAAKITIKFFRSEIIRRKLESLPAAMIKPVRDAMAQGGALVVERAQLLAPRGKESDSPVLIPSIRAEFIAGDERRANVQAMKIGPSGEYLEAHGRIRNLPRWMEFGTAPQTKGTVGVRFAKGGKLRRLNRVSTITTRGRLAQPFLMPAWRQTKTKVRAMIAKAVNSVLGTVSKSR